MRKVASVYFNLARVEAKTGHEVEAVEHYRAFLKIAPTDPRVTDNLVDSAKTSVAELLKRVPQIDIEAPPDAKLTLDARPLEEVPTEPIAVAPGRHVVKGSLNGKMMSSNVEAQVGQVAKAKLDFGGTQDVTPPPVEPEQSRSTSGWAVPIGLGVLGVAGIVTGAAFASASSSSKDDLAPLRAATPGVCAEPRVPACAPYDDKVSSTNTQGTLAWVGYGVGTAALAAAVLTFVFWPKSSKSSPQTGTILTPVLGPQMAGTNLQLHF